MKIGVILPQTEIGPDPAVVRHFVEAAEHAGFHYLLAYDHVLGADISGRADWPGPYTVAHQFHEPLVTFGWLAALTSMELVTGVVVLPQRQTVLVAKQAAQVDLLAGGRFRLGVGVGWSPVEYEALGEDFHTRGARYEEQVEVLRLLWTNEVVDFHGRWHTIDRAGILPRPVQRPIPIWMGTRTSERVLRRVGRLADGWISNQRVGAGFEEALAVVRSGAEAAGRDPQSVGIQGVVDVASDSDLRSVGVELDALAALGATHASLHTMGVGRNPGDHIDLLSRLDDLDLRSR